MREIKQSAAGEMVAAIALRSLREHFHKVGYTGLILRVYRRPEG
jgi:hypothetical protein